MISKKQLEANRKNALKSSGPKNSEGKAVSCQNALQHGILSELIIQNEEDLIPLENLRESLREAFKPFGALEELLLEKMVGYTWRLRRVLSAEQESLSYIDYLGELRTVSKAIGGNGWQKYSRYETMLERHFYKALHELQRIQAMRLGVESEIVPVAVDIFKSSD